MKTGPIEKIRDLLHLESKDAILIIFYSLIIAVFSLVVPVAISSLVNTVAFGIFLQPVIVLTLLVFISYIFVTILTLMQTILTEMVQRRFFARTAMGIASRFPLVSRNVVDKYHMPELINRYFDTMTVQKGMITLLLDALPGFLGAIVSLFIIAIYHPLFLFFDIFVLIIAIGLLGYAMGKPAYHSKFDESDAKYKVGAWLQEIGRHNLSFHTDRGFRFALQKTEHVVNGYLKARETHFRHWLRQYFGFLTLKSFSSALFLGLGGYLVIERQLTLGQLVAAEIIVLTIVDNLTKFGKYLEVFYDVSAAVGKLTKLEDVELLPERVGLKPDVKVPFMIELNNLQLTDREGHDYVSELSLTIKPGEIIGISGDNPIGTGMLLEAIAGLREINDGAITLAGYDQRDLSEQFLREQVLFMRSNEIFSGSLLENVMLCDDRSEAEVRDALEKVGLNGNLSESFGTGLTENLNTYGSDLNHTTGLQIMMARALVHNPSVLLIDESLDAMAVYAIEYMVKVLASLKKKTTVLLITYNPDLLSVCDRVIMFRRTKYTISTNNNRRGKNVR